MKTHQLERHLDYLSVEIAKLTERRERLLDQWIESLLADGEREAKAELEAEAQHGR